MSLKYEPPLDRAAINRENSLKSTGPITEAGKKKSALNAIRHGLTAQTVVLPQEDLDEYQRFTRSFHDDMKPVGVLETQLVQSIADDTWRLNRAKAIETNLFTLGLHDKSSSIDTDSSAVRDALAIARALSEQTRALATLSMHQSRIARTMDRTLKQLREIQAERREKERQDLRLASRLYLLHAHEHEASEPYDPAADGFVFSIPEIEAYVQRRRLQDAAYSRPLFG